MRPSRLGPAVCTCPCISSAIRDGGGPLPILYGPSAGGVPGDDLARSEVNGAQHDLPRPFDAFPEGQHIHPQSVGAIRCAELDSAAHRLPPCVYGSARVCGSPCAGAIRRATGGRRLRPSADSGHGHGRGHGEPRGSAHFGIGQWRLRRQRRSIQLRRGESAGGRHVYAIGRLHARCAWLAPGSGGAGGHGERREDRSGHDVPFRDEPRNERRPKRARKDQAFRSRAV